MAAEFGSEHPAFRQEDLEIRSKAELDNAKEKAGVTTKEEAIKRRVLLGISEGDSSLFEGARRELIQLLDQQHNDLNSQLQEATSAGNEAEISSLIEQISKLNGKKKTYSQPDKTVLIAQELLSDVQGGDSLPYDSMIQLIKIAFGLERKHLSEFNDEQLQGLIQAFSEVPPTLTPEPGTGHRRGEGPLSLRTRAKRPMGRYIQDLYKAAENETANWKMDVNTREEALGIIHLSVILRIEEILKFLLDHTKK
ncbi:MAG: hypothetical protein Q8R08_04245 [bacterium]|nr:hypothetical protein [bacterium]